MSNTTVTIETDDQGIIEQINEFPASFEFSGVSYSLMSKAYNKGVVTFKLSAVDSAIFETDNTFEDANAMMESKEIEYPSVKRVRLNWIDYSLTLKRGFRFKSQAHFDCVKCTQLGGGCSEPCGDAESVF